MSGCFGRKERHGAGAKPQKLSSPPAISSRLQLPRLISRAQQLAPASRCEVTSGGTVDGSGAEDRMVWDGRAKTLTTRALSSNFQQRLGQILRKILRVF
jgi:hypothetical protein